ncbi:MAG: tetratricopeptide repeat protein, partial [Bacteroidota bacterium]
ILSFLFSCTSVEESARMAELKRLSREGFFAESNALGSQMLLTEPNNSEVIYIMSNNFAELGEEDSALSYLDRTIALEPEWGGPHNNKGIIYQDNGNHEQAIKAFSKAIDVEPEFPYSYNNRGYSKMLLGQFKDGMKDVLKSEELDDDNAYIYRNKAIFYEKTGKLANACKWLQKAYGKRFYDQIESQLEFIELRVCK